MRLFSMTMCLSMILMATYWPFSVFTANLTLAKVPSPIVLLSWYFPMLLATPISADDRMALLNSTFLLPSFPQLPTTTTPKTTPSLPPTLLADALCILPGLSLCWSWNRWDLFFGFFCAASSHFPYLWFSFLEEKKRYVWLRDSHFLGLNFF